MHALLLGNSPPNITGDSLFVVNVGEENAYSFFVNDTNEFNVTIEGGAPEGADLVHEGDGIYTLTWTLSSVPTSELSFVATDISGAATLHSPVIQICACFNGGVCTEDGVPSTNELLQALTCLCTEGTFKRGGRLIILHLLTAAYTGDTCSEDKNGCAEVECFQGVECFDVPAPGVGAECGSCETGFTGDGLKCTGMKITY